MKKWMKIETGKLAFGPYKGPEQSGFIWKIKWNGPSIMYGQEEPANELSQ